MEYSAFLERTFHVFTDISTCGGPVGIKKSAMWWNWRYSSYLLKLRGSISMENFTSKSPVLKSWVGIRKITTYCWLHKEVLQCAWVLKIKCYVWIVMLSNELQKERKETRKKYKIRKGKKARLKQELNELLKERKKERIIIITCLPLLLITD